MTHKFEFEVDENLEFYNKSHLDWLIPALDFGLRVGLGMAGLYILLSIASSITNYIIG